MLDGLRRASFVLVQRRLAVALEHGSRDHTAARSLMASRVMLTTAFASAQLKASIEYEVPDIFGRPWAHTWEKHHEQHMQPPGGDDPFDFSR